MFGGSSVGVPVTGVPRVGVPQRGLGPRMGRLSGVSQTPRNRFVVPVVPWLPAQGCACTVPGHTHEREPKPAVAPPQPSDWQKRATVEDPGAFIAIADLPSAARLIPTAPNALE